MPDTLDPQDPAATAPDADLGLVDTPTHPVPAVASTPVAPPPTVAAPVTTPAVGATGPVLPPLPAGVTLAPVGSKLAAALLDGLLAVVTLWVGWLIWGAIVAGKGQTPGRQVLGLRVVGVHDGRPLSWGQMVFLHGLVGSIVSNFAFVFTLGVLAFMPLWDRRNQTVADKVASSIVVRDPNRAYG